MYCPKCERNLFDNEIIRPDKSECDLHLFCLTPVVLSNKKPHIELTVQSNLSEAIRLAQESFSNLKNVLSLADAGYSKMDLQDSFWAGRYSLNSPWKNFDEYFADKYPEPVIQSQISDEVLDEKFAKAYADINIWIERSVYNMRDHMDYKIKDWIYRLDIDINYLFYNHESNFYNYGKNITTDLLYNHKDKKIK
jgi:hypothetical protein